MITSLLIYPLNSIRKFTPKQKRFAFFCVKEQTIIELISETVSLLVVGSLKKEEFKKS